ncbi:MAG: hypothetical protein AB8H86_25880 [Polyangiales bacterium]
MKRTSLFMVALLALSSACGGGDTSPTFTSANLCVEDDFQSIFPSVKGHYALGTEVRFELTSPVTEYETHLEIEGDAFEWRSLQGGVIEAHAVAEGVAQLHVFIDGEIVSSEELISERATTADVADAPSLLLSVARMICEDCGGEAGDEPRVALGSAERLRIDYLNEAGETLEGRGLGDDAFVDIDEGRDSLELFTELEGLFALPVNVDGQQLSTFSYRVAEAETLRIIRGDYGIFAEALDADGVTLLGDFEWFIDDAPVQLEHGVVMLDDAQGRTIRVRLGGAEATLEVL